MNVDKSTVPNPTTAGTLSGALAETFVNTTDYVHPASLRLAAAPFVQLMIPFVMATERLAGYENLVGRWDEKQPIAALQDARHVYFVGMDDGAMLRSTRCAPVRRSTAGK